MIIKLLKIKRFLPLFLTQSLGTFNANLFKNALLILMTYKMTLQLNAEILVTLAAGIFVFPFFLFSATAGQLADKFEKSRLIRVIKFSEIILMLMGSIGLYFNNIIILISVLFLIGTQSAFFGPIKYAILPECLQDKELVAGNGLIEAGTFLAILFGTILGGVIIVYPKGFAFVSLLICLIAITGYLSSLWIPKTIVRHSAINIRYNFIAETYRIIQYSKAKRDIFLCILGISWFWAVGATFLAEFPGFAKNELHANSTIVTYFFFLFSVGIAIGSLCCSKLLKGKIHANYVPFGALGMALFTLDLYFAASHVAIITTSPLTTLIQFLQSFRGWRISFDLILFSICSGLYTVPLYAILQHRSEETHRARVIASNNIMNALFMVLSSVFTIIMLKMKLSVNEVFLCVAIGCAIVTVYICKLVPENLIQKFFLSMFNRK